MSLRIASSRGTTAAQIASELQKGLGSQPLRFVLLFASSTHDPVALAAAMGGAFGPVPTIGCTTAGEIISGAMLEGSVIAAGFGHDLIECAAIARVDDMQDPRAVDRALETLGAQLGSNIADLDPTKHIGLVLHDGLSVAEERVMDRLTDLTNLPFVGGSAGDDTKFVKTHVFAHGEAWSSASVLAILRPVRPYRILKTQSFDVLDKVLRVTDVDESTRTVRSFNDRPAAEAYAEAIGIPVEKLPTRFQDSPLGLVVRDGDPFVRSPQQVKGADVVFYCRVQKGMELHLLRGRNIVDDTKRDLQKTITAMASCSGILNFHCILRTIELQQKAQTAAYAELFAPIPTLGFSTYGESFIGHINQTSTMVLFE